MKIIKETIVIEGLRKFKIIHRADGSRQKAFIDNIKPSKLKKLPKLSSTNDKLDFIINELGLRDIYRS